MTHSQLKQGREQLLLNPSTASGAICAREVGTMHSSRPGPWQGLRVNGLVGNSFNPRFEAYLPATGLHTRSLSEAIPPSHELLYPFRNQHPLLAYRNPRLPRDEGTQQRSTPGSLPRTTLLFPAAQQSQLEGKRLFADCFLERLCFPHRKHAGEECEHRATHKLDTATSHWGSRTNSAPVCRQTFTFAERKGARTRDPQIYRPMLSTAAKSLSLLSTFLG